MMKQKVVIIGHSYSSRLSIIRSVAQIGCEITVIVMTGVKRDGKTLNTKKPIDCYSKYVSHVYYCLRKDKEVFIRILLERCADPQQKVILIPDSDDTVAAIDNNREKLNKHFLFPHIINQPNSMEYWMDKAHQKDAAREVGLNVANAKIIEIKDGHYIIPENLHYPCLIKPLATMNGGKWGMRRCDNLNDVTSDLDSFIAKKSRDGKMLVEDYIDIHQEYALLGFSDGKQVIIPAILKFLAVSEQNRGIARQGMVIPVNNLQKLVDIFKELILRVGFVGVFDIDFYESNGVFYFCEINLRFGGSGYAITKMGVNLPAMMVKYLSGESISAMNKTITSSATYANERMCIDDWFNGYISTKEYQNILFSSDIRFIPNQEDPKPERMYNREFWLKSFRIFVRNILIHLWKHKYDK